MPPSTRSPPTRSRSGIDSTGSTWTFQRPDGGLESHFFGTGAPGPVEAQSIVEGSDGVERAASEPRIQGFWRQTSLGYHLEIRIPLSLVGPRLWVEAVDGSSAATAGFMGADTKRGGRLFVATPNLSPLLASFIGAGTRATVVDANNLKLGSAGSLSSNPQDESRQARRTWYRDLISGDTSRWPIQMSAPDHLEGRSIEAALAGRSSAEWVRGAVDQTPLLTATAPILLSGQTRGAVVLEQAGDQFLEMRDRALARLFNLTLLATAFAVAIAVGMATWISLRIDRLRIAADTAVGTDGTIRLGMPESRRSDEIGALARAFERLLGRLNEHTQYLRTLGGKLSHELRTPLSIVRSSLDNLESEGVRENQRGYTTRAREGVLRLQSILSALGAAARVEESIKQAERVSFDLKALLHFAVAGYCDAFESGNIELDTPPGECFMRGAPDLIVQMLDKLIENAVDFCAVGGKIVVRLTRSGGNYELSVANDGPLIPLAMIETVVRILVRAPAGQPGRAAFRPRTLHRAPSSRNSTTARRGRPTSRTRVQFLPSSYR